MHLVPALVAFDTQELPQPADRRRVDRFMRLKTVGSGVVLAAMAAASVPAQSQRIAAEITRLRAAAPEILPEGSRAAIVARLDRARVALADGRRYLALYDLQTAFEAEAGYRLASEQAYADYDAFTRKWMDVGAPADPPSQKADVLFIEALAQSAEARAPATYRASLPYAKDAGLSAGLYYLGESHAMIRFAALCRSLELSSTGRKPELTSIEPALAVHEQEVVKAYDRADASRRPQYAGVNVAIKLARTLDGQGRHEGALLQYLLSRFRFGLIAADTRTAGPAGEIERRLGPARPPAGVDHSIGEFFLQLAFASAKGSSPAPAAAPVILDDVLPAYFAMVKP
jgi:hypothetical protein